MRSFLSNLKAYKYISIVLQLRAVFVPTYLSRDRLKPEKLETSLALLTPTQIVHLANRNFSLASAFVENKLGDVSWASAAQVIANS
jgi:hypothetical protein